MKANTICKYSKCNLGKDGGRKHYYSCNYCTATENWKSMACCKEHYNLYIEEVLSARAKGMHPDTLPDRTDITKDELKKIKKKPRKQVLQETKDELKDYSSEIEEIGMPAVIEKINQELDKI